MRGVADPSFPHLLTPEAKHRGVTPLFGTEIEDVQLTSLSSEGLDELALLVAQRGFAVFRKQDWKDAGKQKQLAIARHFGPLHQHQKATHAGDDKEISVVYQSAADVTRPNYWGERASKIQWHVDVSHEKQPPGVTFFAVLENQDWVGGDTIMADTVQAFADLSSSMKDFLLGLHAIHSDNQKTFTAIREDVNTIHPLVVSHPVTRDKILFVNETFTRKVPELKLEESDYLLKFLFDYLGRSLDFQARVKWEEGTVIVWDQRRALHTATLDSLQGKRRHMVRLMSLAGKPIPAGADK